MFFLIMRSVTNPLTALFLIVGTVMDSVKKKHFRDKDRMSSFLLLDLSGGTEPVHPFWYRHLKTCSLPRFSGFL